MATNRNWLKRLFRLDFDDQFDAALDLIEVQEIAIVDVHDRVDGVQEAVKVVTGRVDTVEGKLAALKTFDFFGRTVVAQFDYEKSIVGDTSITVSIDNVAAQAFLRFGSARVVDTIDAVWFISKTGVPIQNDFGDVLHPAAQRRDVQDFLYMTSEKQGDEPLDIIIPEHTHDNYISIEELEEVKDALDLKFDKAGGDLASGGAFIGTNRLKPQGAGANTLYEGTSYSHPQSLINSGMMKEYAAEKDHDTITRQRITNTTRSSSPINSRLCMLARRHRMTRRRVTCGCWTRPMTRLSRTGCSCTWMTLGSRQHRCSVNASIASLRTCWSRRS